MFYGDTAPLGEKSPLPARAMTPCVCPGVSTTTAAIPKHKEKDPYGD
jgi:hypothetical protein